MSRGKWGIISYRVGWLLVALSLVTGAAAVSVLAVSVGSDFKDQLFREPCTTPCTRELDLDEGRYSVFEQTAHSTGAGPFTLTMSGPTTIRKRDVSVTAPNGATLVVSKPIDLDTVTRGDTTYSAAVSFQTPAAGHYVVTIESPEATQVFIAPDVGQTLGRALPGFAIAAVAALTFLAGFGVLLATLIRHQNSKASS